jgi:hypothetical protein
MPDRPLVRRIHGTAIYVSRKLITAPALLVRDKGSRSFYNLMFERSRHSSNSNPSPRSGPSLLGNSVLSGLSRRFPYAGALLLWLSPILLPFDQDRLRQVVLLSA